jgi:hypothetical protein
VKVEDSHEEALADDASASHLNILYKQSSDALRCMYAMGTR